MIGTDSTIRVLFIDDNPDLLSAVSDYLTLTCQMHVTPVQDVQAVFEYEWLDYDCIILDYDMPDINGIEALKKIRTIAPSVGVIVFTGKSHEEVVIEALNNGADYYLRKGQNAHVFTELVHYIVQSSRRYRAEKESLVSQALYHLVVELQGEFVCTLKRDGTILFANDAYCSYLNTSEDILIGTNFFSIVKDNGTLQEIVQQLLHKSDSYHFTRPLDTSSAVQRESIVVSTHCDGVEHSEHWTFCSISDAQYGGFPKNRT
ncbi:MAG: response regulator, partial [Euryarchaeota archaeon]|nr:response regulator [Euryarchaeota archaeon]